ncbi:MAG: BMP family ABC transporter substrate-binding protein [Agathobacter sp.]|jgi:basic membrane protein A and related proteins|nr:BMP family ABC transporter substrate-binding protein [Agathobacter sp.]
MGDQEYTEALKLGKKEYKSCVSQGRFPYLPVLDDILSREEVRTEQNMGLIQIPLDFVVGTSTMGRTYSFAANFMPILRENTEFAVKWANLSDAQINEGIRDPIVAYEYMNRYYVVEGNKRVSVLKYFKADSIVANVTRKIPKYSEDEDVKIYYEYMKFNEITGLFNIEFSKPGMAEQLLELTGCTTRWDPEVRSEFNSLLLHFTRAYEFRGGSKLPITVGDALTAFINVYGYKESLAMSDAEMNTNVVKCWNEFVVLTHKHTVGLVMDPTSVQEKKSLLSYLLPTSNRKFTVAFLYPKSPEESDWIYAHELGRNYLEETFPDQMKTICCVSGVHEENVEDVLSEVIRNGADIVFEVAPQMMKPSLKIAVDHPDVKILNCTLNTSHKYIRTYYARMYEAKFIAGVIAGALADNNKIAYIADYPIYGMIANINAFALGASFTNPRAQIYLEWSTKKDYDREHFLTENDISVVSDQDMITPSDTKRQFGLYRIEEGRTLNLAMPLWNWGIFYEKMIQSILAGSYQTEGNSEDRALNYWWGMSAGVIDMICSNNVPAGVRRLADHLKHDIKKGDMVPFYGEIYSQDGELRNKSNVAMKPEAIMEMDWLVANVKGSIPTMDTLIDAAQTVVQLKGVEETK